MNLCTECYTCPCNAVHFPSRLRAKTIVATAASITMGSMPLAAHCMHWTALTISIDFSNTPSLLYRISVHPHTISSIQVPLQQQQVETINCNNTIGIFESV